MRHQDLTINHRLESWVFANAAARNAAGSYVAADVGRIAYTNDTADYWRLLSVTPTWKRLNGIYANYQSSAGQTPTKVTSLLGLMAGLGSSAWGSASITPTVTGKVLITITGAIFNDLSVGSAFASLRYGSGAAPNNGASPTGTVTQATALRSPLGTNVIVPFAVTFIATGLTVGTPYWIDLLLGNNNSSGAVGVVLATVTAAEIP